MREELTLALLVTGILADNASHPLPLTIPTDDETTVLADGFG